jgi:EF-P beta-lysylation protein EpmB
MEIKRAMLARTGAHCQTPSWKRELAAAYRDPRQLLSHLGLDEGLFATALAAGRGFPMLVPRCYAALMEPGNPDDPLLRQVLPTAEELIPTPGFSADPVGDQPARRGMGMLQKYRGRVLLIVTGACPIHCRYCFRRHYPYRGGTTAGDAGSEAWDLVRRDETIEEVILSGGDPLTLDDGALAAIIGRIAAITHVRRIRIHTRLPIVLPSRVTPELSRLLAGTRLQVVMVVHANHPRELGTAASGALRRIASGGITLLNQSVLLRGVNDRPRILCELSEALFANGALPYYLHLLDRVQGAAHFEVAPARASRIARALRARLPGYLVPRIVREEAGLAYKAPVC